MFSAILRNSIFICCILFGCGILTVRAQQFNFEQLGTRQGLPSSEVYGLHIDSKGYIWAFTNYGMVKHNGERFVKVCNNIPFRRSIIFANREDEKGNFFVANSRAEILRIKNDSAFIIEGLEKLSAEILKEGDVIYNFSINDTSIIISTNQFTYKVDLKNKGNYINIAKHYSLDTLVLLQRSPTSYIACNTVTREESSKEAVKQRINILFLNTAGKKHLKLIVSNTRPTRHYVEKHGNMIYLMFANQIFFINTTAGIVRSITTPKQILNYSIDESGNIWVCFYKGGLSMYDKRGLFKKSYFEKLTVTDIVHDKLNGIWISSLENGIFYCSNKYEKHFDNIPSIGTENITCLKAFDTMLFIGTMPGSLILMNKTINSYALKNTGYENNDILDAVPYGSDYIIGIKNGVFKLSKNKISRVSPKYATCNLLFNCSDSILYLTNRTVETLKLKPVIKQTHYGILKLTVICGFYKYPYNILLGTDNGLYTYDLKKREIINHSLNEKIIRKIYTDCFNNTWICTKGDGLYKISSTGDTIHLKNTPVEFINDIKVRKDSIIILATNAGLYYTKFKHLDMPCWINIFNNEVLNLALFNNKIFAGTKNGLVSFEEAILFTHLKPKFYLHSLKVNDLEKSISKFFDVAYNENNIAFDFDYLNFNSHKQLSYTLTGPLKLSGLTSETEVRFQNLIPGTYRLSVSPVIGGEKKSRTLSFIFTIEPAFWQTSWFLVTVIICIVVLILIIFLFVLKTRERKRKKYFEIEKQLAEQKLTALKAQINPHFISNSLSAIQQLIHAEEIDSAGKYIAMFSVFIRKVLNFSDKVLVSLEEEIKVIELYVELEQLRFTDKFSFIKNIAPDVDVYYTSVPPLITQPLIENAIWHGLLRLNDLRDPVLTLNVYKNGTHVIIEIEDNGIGRSPQLNAGPSKESKGTLLVKKRIENLNKIHIDLNASMQIEDLRDANGFPIGTKVIISCNSII